MAAGAMRHGGVLGAALLLGGCGLLSGDWFGSAGDTGPAPCPRIAILADGADLTRFRAGAPRDLTTQVLDARISGFNASCDWASRDRRSLGITVTPLFEVERGPAAEGRVVDLPWFVALTDPTDSQVIAREAYTVRVTFPANVQRAQQPGQRVRLTLPLPEGQRAGEYNLRISFQLSPEELAVNRQRGPR
jgi:hypothetical protein